MKKSRLLLNILLLLVLGFFVFLKGPSAIHAAYRVATSEYAMERKLNRYDALSFVNTYKLSGAEQSQAIAEREQISRWFLARGLTIYKGHEEPAPADAWQELFTYWTQG